MLVKKPTLAGLTLLASLLLASGAQAAPDAVARLAWMQGCWAETGAQPGSGEFWSGAAGGSLIGMSRTIKDGKTVAYEFIQIREVEPGQLAYIVQPSGRPPTTFRLKPDDGKQFVFENLEHDFPQRVIYRRDGERGVRARIEGMSKGVLKGIDFPLQRVSCEPSPP